MKINTELQKNLAALLARENIKVVFGNFSTASFDIKNRIMQLPLWKHRDIHVYHMITCHEVAHALYTKKTKFEKYYTDNQDKKHFKILQTIVNIVEDIRIEKIIQREYPGAKYHFTKGYKTLFEENFFGKKEEIQDQNFLVRLNYKAKCRDHADNISYTDEELPYVDIANACETIEDVFDASEKILEFLKTQSQEQKKQTKQDQSDDDQENDQENDQDSDQGGDQNDDQEGDQSDNDDSESSESESNNEKSNDQDDDQEGDRENEYCEDHMSQIEEECSETEDGFSKFIDKSGSNKLILKIPPKKHCLQKIIPWKKLYK